MIVSELMGGMGNQMFQYALGRYLSIKHRTTLLLDVDFLLDRSPRKDFVYRDFDLDIFNIRERFAPHQLSKKFGILKSSERKFFQRIVHPYNLKYLREEQIGFNAEVLTSGNNTYLHGYWQSEKYFTNIENTIRKDFTFKTRINEKAQLIGDRIRACNAVCLNVRRGDFVTNPITSEILGTIGNEYYALAVNYIKDQIARPIIFIFSDEIQWCKENLRFDLETVYVSHEYAGEKFRDYLELMMLCKHFIIPNSSFAWWAAWLCSNPDKIVIVPKMWFRSSSWNDQDIAPKSWIKI